MNQTHLSGDVSTACVILLSRIHVSSRVPSPPGLLAVPPAPAVFKPLTGTVSIRFPFGRFLTRLRSIAFFGAWWRVFTDLLIYVVASGTSISPSLPCLCICAHRGGQVLWSFPESLQRFRFGIFKNTGKGVMLYLDDILV